MALYDCGNPDCVECQRQFGPDRSKAIAEFRAREAGYNAALPPCDAPEPVSPRLAAEMIRDTERAIAQARMWGEFYDSVFGLPRRK